VALLWARQLNTRLGSTLAGPFSRSFTLRGAMALDDNNATKPQTSTLVHAVSNTVTATRSRLTSPTLTRTLLRLVFFGLLSTASLVIGTVAYVAFYNTYIPVRGMSAPVWLQYGFGRPPFAVVDLKAHQLVFAENQPYAITLELVVPANERNIDLGLPRLTPAAQSSVGWLTAPHRQLHGYSQPRLERQHDARCLFTSRSSLGTLMAIVYTLTAALFGLRPRLYTNHTWHARSGRSCHRAGGCCPHLADLPNALTSPSSLELCSVPIADPQSPTRPL
jgi:hypothetical protein